MKIIALSGSLRAASLNSALLRATAQSAPSGVEIDVYPSLGELPLFNPDIEASDPPPVAKLRTRILAADAVLIASPEYAHGISSVMKNALDWMVSSEAFVGKPVALLNASARAVHAQAALKEVVTVMSARVIEEACITVTVLGIHRNEVDILADTEICTALRKALKALQAACA